MDNYSRVPNAAWFLIIWDVGSLLESTGILLNGKEGIAIYFMLKYSNYEPFSRESQ